MDKLKEIDALLARITVSGDGVLLLAAARKLLKAVYDSAKEGDNG